MVNFGVICDGLLNLSRVRGLPGGCLKSAALAFKDMEASAGSCNFQSLEETQPGRRTLRNL